MPLILAVLAQICRTCEPKRALRQAAIRQRSEFTDSRIHNYRVPRATGATLSPLPAFLILRA